MTIFKLLTIQNFLSFGHKPTTIKLDETASTLILGKNKDVGAEGYSRNGVGKSSIFQALSWVLFNEGISVIKQDAFINIVNKKKMVVELVMEVDDIEFIIRRGRKPAVCEVLKDGEPYTMHSSATVDDTIEKLIGINFDTFCNTVLLNTTTTPFMGMKPSPQRDFMEKMVGLDVLSERANKLKSHNKDVVVEIKLEEQNKVHVIGNYDRVKLRIDSLSVQSTNWERSHTDELKDVNDTIKGLSVIDIEKTQKTNELIRTTKDDIAKLKVLIADIDKLTNDDLVKAASTHAQLLEKVVNGGIKIFAEAESTYKEESSNLTLLSQETRSQFESDSNDKSIDLINKRSELEKSLIEKKALLKESTAFIVDVAKQLRVLVGKDDELRGEIKTLMSGICPYCKQEHVDNNKVDEITSELNHIDEDANELGRDAERVGAGIDELKLEITEVEDELTDVTKLTDAIHSDLNKLLVTSQREQADKQRELDGDLEVELHRVTEETKFNKDNRTDEYDAAVVEIGMEATENKKSYEEEVDKLSTELPDEVYTDTECIEIISELKNLNKQLVKLNGETNPYTDQLTQTRTDLIDYDETALNDLRDKESHYKLLIKMLTDNKSFIRKNLLEQYIPFINSKIGEYTTKLELPHVVTINTDLTVDIDYMQSSVSYGNLSNGECGRLNFSVSMAFRDLMSVSGHNFNFLGIDELLDNGIDTSGFHAIFKLLKEREKENVFLISHRDDLITEVDTIMEVVKENGFTKIN